MSRVMAPFLDPPEAAGVLTRIARSVWNSVYGGGGDPTMLYRFAEMDWSSDRMMVAAGCLPEGSGVLRVLPKAVHAVLLVKSESFTKAGLGTSPLTVASLGEEGAVAAKVTKVTLLPGGDGSVDWRVHVGRLVPIPSHDQLARSKATRPTNVDPGARSTFKVTPAVQSGPLLVTTNV